jgi:hypothetical protein
MPCCLSNVYQPNNSITQPANRFQLPIVVEEESLPLIFSYFGAFNANPTELKATLHHAGMLKFIGIEAGLQISNRGGPGPHEGKYVGTAIFERQQIPGGEDTRKNWLPLLLRLFPGET